MNASTRPGTSAGLPTDTDARLESSLERSLFAAVRNLGGHAYKLAPTTKGLPDRLVLLPGGRVQLIELKTTRGALSPSQRVLHGRLRALGTDIQVLYGHAAIQRWHKDMHATLAQDQAAQEAAQDARQRRADRDAKMSARAQRVQDFPITG